MGRNVARGCAAGVMLAAALAAAGGAHANGSADQTGRPKWRFVQAGSALDLSRYKLAWSDEFSTLKATPYYGSGPWFAPVHANMSLGVLQSAPSDVYSVSDGVLHMRTMGSGATWKTGNLQTANDKFQGFALQNGYFEIRAKMPSTRGSWSAFWLLSAASSTAPHAEIDVVEYYGADDACGIHTTTHVWPAPHPQAGDPTTHWWLSTYDSEKTLATAFHTYGVMLTPAQVIFYFDGVEKYRIKRQDEQQVPMYLLLSNFMNASAKVLQPADMQVDYVRAYAPA